MLGLQFIQKLQPVEPRALQPDVEEDQARTPPGNFLERRIGIVGLSGLVALVFEDTRDQVADVFLVVNDQNVQSHMLVRRGTNVPRLLS